MSLTNLGSQAREIELTSYAEIVLAPPGGRRRAPGLPEPVRPDGVRSRARGPPGDPPSAIPRRAAGVGSPRRGRRGRGGAGSSSTRPTAAASSAAVARSARRSRSSTGARSRTRSARCSTRSSASAAGSGSHPARRPTRSSPRSSPSRARRSWTSPTSTARRPPSSARPPSPGRRPRSSSITWGSRATRPTSSSAWPTGSSTPTRRFGRRRACWPATNAGRRASGPTASRATCPIVLVRIDELEDVDIVRQLLRAHEYWRLKLLDVDLVILNEHGATYAQNLHDSLEALVRTSRSTLAHEGRPVRGGVHILRGDHLSAEDRTLLQAAARAVLLSRRGTLADQVIRLERSGRRAPPPAPSPPRETGGDAAAPRPELEFFNGLGGFADGGREYVTILGPGQATPAPWLNVIANPTFGFLVVGVRRGVRLVGQQPREPAHAVVKRPRHRPRGRGDLRPRRRDRRPVEPDDPADPPGAVDVRRPSRRRATAASSTSTAASSSTWCSSSRSTTP